MLMIFAPVVAQEISDPVKAEIFQRFSNNRGRAEIAYQAAKEYLEKYGKDKDKYTNYLEKWVSIYEREERKRKLPILIKQKDFTEAFRVGARILADEPNYLQAQIALAYAGYLAALDKDETHTVKALSYARTAIELVERGRTPQVLSLARGADNTVNIWAPFKNKDDTLAHLNCSRGYLALKTNPDESIDAFIKAVQYESDLRLTSSIYYFLATAYEVGPYKTFSDAHSLIGNTADPAVNNAALEKLNGLVDRIIDAYARAIVTANADPKTEQSQGLWLEKLTTYYKFRHGGSDVGLTELIASVLKTSLPQRP